MIEPKLSTVLDEMRARNEPQKRRPMLEYRIPLDAYECTAKLELPRDLTLAEAQRIFAVMKTLIKE